jgi:hypothetical protein
MTEDKLKEIRARCEAATPGPWGVRIDKDSLFPVQYSGWVGYENADAEFIANAREDIPMLLAEIERLTHDRNMGV